MKHIEFSEHLKNDIIMNFVEPSYKKDIIRNLKLKKKFKTYALFFETLSKFFVGMSSILSFASGIYKYEIMTFLSGTTSVISLILLQYSSFSYRESKKIGIELNDMLSKLNITSIVDNTSVGGDSLENEPHTPLTLKI